MAFALYLAMTAAEIVHNRPLPAHLCYMACHFSAYATGLSNLPESLPAGSIISLNDRMSYHDHDPLRILRQLEEIVSAVPAGAVLLDFQRPPTSQTLALAETLQQLPCPVAVSSIYAQKLSCPVFVPPPPMDQPLAQYLDSWPGRPIWLDIAPQVQNYCVTARGCTQQALPAHSNPTEGFEDRQLHCHYTLRLQPGQANFTLWRNSEDLQALLLQAGQLGVERAIGLYQQLGCMEKAAADG